MTDADKRIGEGPSSRRPYKSAVSPAIPNRNLSISPQGDWASQANWCTMPSHKHSLHLGLCVESHTTTGEVDINHGEYVLSREERS